MGYTTVARSGFLQGKMRAFSDENLVVVVVDSREAPWKQVMDIRAGDILDIEARGAWTVFDTRWDPEPQQTARSANRMKGRIGSKIYDIGPGAQIVVEVDGVLELGTGDRPENLRDKQGSLHVKITRTAGVADDGQSTATDRDG